MNLYFLTVENTQFPEIGEAWNHLPSFTRSFRLISLAITVIVFNGCSEVSRTRKNDDGNKRADQSVLDDVDTYAVARKQWQQGNSEAAWASIQQCLVVDPNDADTLELAGDIAATMQTPGRMTEMYQAAIEQASKPSRLLLE